MWSPKIGTPQCGFCVALVHFLDNHSFRGATLLNHRYYSFPPSCFPFFPTLLKAIPIGWKRLPPATRSTGTVTFFTLIFLIGPLPSGVMGQGLPQAQIFRQSTPLLPSAFDPSLFFHAAPHYRFRFLPVYQTPRVIERSPCLTPLFFFPVPLFPFPFQVDKMSSSGESLSP